MKKVLYRLTANKLAFISGVIVLLLVLSAVLAPILSPFNPLKNDIANRFLKPFATEHFLGTDEMGRDILSRIIFGGRVSLLVGVEAVLFAFLAGSIPAIFAGFFGGKTEFVVMRIVDILFAIPSLILALSIVGLLGRSMVAVSIAVGLAYTPVFARVTYSSVVAIRNQGYVEAARALGTNPLKIIARDIFPNVLPLILVQATASISWAILAEAGLGFIGLGVNPPTPSWGLMLASARTYIMEEPWMSIFPGVAILITVFAFNLFGDGLRDLLDPRAWQAGE
jgi:peptide/nickel transport system permease protein